MGDDDEEQGSWGDLDEEKTRWEAASESVIDPLTDPDNLTPANEIARWEVCVNQLEAVGILGGSEAKDLRARILKWYGSQKGR